VRHVTVNKTLQDYKRPLDDAYLTIEANFIQNKINNAADYELTRSKNVLNFSAQAKS